MRKGISSILALVAIFCGGQAQAYKIDLSQGGLVDPLKATTRINYTSPFDAEYNATTKKTDVWLTDMNGSYSGRRVFNWTLDESSGSALWTYNGAFTVAGNSGIRALNIMDSGRLLVGRGNGRVETYARSTGPAGYTDVAAALSSFAVGGAGSVHHMGYDSTTGNIWTVRGAGVNNAGVAVGQYNQSGALVSAFTTAATYIEGIGVINGDVYVYNAGASVYGNPSDGLEGHILKYSNSGSLLDDFAYETGDRPPFHSEALSYDGTHFWMAGYSDGKVYRLAAEAGEKLVPEPGMIILVVSGLLLLAFLRLAKGEAHYRGQALAA